ncbi:MAG: HPr kinase/phosphorylase, partial [Proteobacteria bacterium]|nr:HPr kinase/phosphorylase [Pseudomonadota bacterium]
MDGELSHVSVETLFRDLAEQLGLQWVAGRTGGDRTLSSETIQKPTLALIG